MNTSHKAVYFTKISLVVLAFTVLIFNLFLTLKTLDKQSEIEQLIINMEDQIEDQNTKVIVDDSIVSSDTVITPRSKSKTYSVETCHYTEKDLTCTADNNLVCTLDFQATDHCSKFVSCSDQGDIQKDALYDTCVDCFSGARLGEEISEECFVQFPDHFLNI